MPWTIPNLLLHDKPARLGNIRSHGRSHMFVVCGNPDCHHNAEVDAGDFPDEVTFGDCNHGCFAPCAITAGADVSPSWLHG
jgi:hypothetical protein